MVVTKQPRIKDRWSPCGRRENLQDYYVPVSVAECAMHYWAEKIDPDGVLRDRDTEAERLQFIEDTQYIIDFVNEKCPHAILDFGAGLGWLLSAIECKWKYAIEVDEKAVERLRSQGVTVYPDCTAVGPCACDVVISHHVIEHLVDPIYELNQWRRTLRPGGWLILGTPDFGSPCARRFGQNYRMLHDPTHRSLFTLESCSRMLRDHGFEIEDVQFPFPERYATAETMERWKDTSKVSPPWPGNWMTFFARKP